MHEPFTLSIVGKNKKAMNALSTSVDLKAFMAS